MKTYEIIYVAASIIIETISIYLGWQKAKNNKNIASFLNAIKQALNTSLQGKKLKQIVFNPITIIIFCVLFLVACPMLLPISIVGWIKKLSGYKSPLDKAIDAEREATKKEKEEWERFKNGAGNVANDIEENTTEQPIHDTQEE